MPHVFGTFLFVLLISGGASRPDEPHQILARLAAIMVTAFAALTMRREHLARVRVPLLFLAAVATVMVLQIIPLPPGLWGALPGRTLYQEGFAVAGIEAVWRPLSLTPDRTLNSLLALLPAFAAVLGLAMMDRAQHRMLAIGLIIAILVSALIGIVQISTGSLYLYRVTNTGSAVGLFANRNHQAALLAAAFPLLAAWVAMPAADRNFGQLRSVLALLAATLLVAMLLATGSRAGLGLGAFAAVAAMAILWLGEARRRKDASWRSNMKFLLPLALGVAAVAASLYFARDIALQRLVTESADDLRHTLRPIYWQMIGDFLPLGSGFGSFDPVFRSYEPYWNLGPAYVNHTHNDYLEVLLEAGLLGGALMAAFLVWFAIRAWRVWTQPGQGGRDGALLLGRAGSIIILVLLAGSAVDYPLRTPLMCFLFAVSSVLMLPAPADRLTSKTKLGTERPIG